MEWSTVFILRLVLDPRGILEVCFTLSFPRLLFSMLFPSQFTPIMFAFTTMLHAFPSSYHRGMFLFSVSTRTQTPCFS